MGVSRRLEVGGGHSRQDHASKGGGGIPRSWLEAIARQHPRPLDSLSKQRLESQWYQHHHVEHSRHNVVAPKTRRAYFDHLPVARVTTDKSQNSDLVTPLPDVLDEHAYLDLIRARFQQVPQHRGIGSPDILDMLVGSARARASATSSQVRPEIPELLQALVTFPEVSSSSSLSRRASAVAAAAADSSSSSLAAAAAKAQKPAPKVKTDLRLLERETNLFDTDSSKEFPKFVAWMKNKNLTLERLWHILDNDKSMSINKREFVQGLANLNYKGDLDRLWSLIDRDASGSVRFMEFAPEAGLELALFKRWADQHFGNAKKMFAAFDSDKSGSVTWSEFCQACIKSGLPTHLRSTLRTLFSVFDADGRQDGKGGSGNGSISEEELRFLDKWECPPCMWAGSDLEARKRFQAAVLSKYENSQIMVWRRALDQTGTMRVNYDEFSEACRTLAKRGLKEADPPCGLPALFNAFDTDRSGWFNLRDWDPPTFELLKNFVEWCREHHSSAYHFIVAAGKIPTIDEDEKKSGVSYRQFSEALKSLDWSHADRMAIFKGLMDPSKQVRGGNAKGYRVFEADTLFLRNWNPTRDLKDDALWGAIVRKAFNCEDGPPGGDFFLSDMEEMRCQESLARQSQTQSQTPSLAQSQTQSQTQGAEGDTASSSHNNHSNNTNSGPLPMTSSANAVAASTAQISS